MSNIIELSGFDKGVNEYKEKEKRITEDFILGVISLGEILKRQRDIWKPQDKWIKYLEEINKSLSGANQYIRIYEYSVKHMKELLSCNLVSWERAYSFLALPDSLKLKLAEEIEGEDISTQEFREKVKEIKTEIDDMGLIEENDISDYVSKQIIGKVLENRVEKAALAFTAIIKKENPQAKITDNFVEVVSGLMTIGTGLNYFTDENISKLNVYEKGILFTFLKDKYKEIYKVIKKLGN